MQIRIRGAGEHHPRALVADLRRQAVFGGIDGPAALWRTRIKHALAVRRQNETPNDS
jgi:hypothetical protein